MTNPGQPPTSDAEWARDTENRLRRLESPNTMRIGPWVVSDRDGELIATRPGEEIVFGQLPADDDTVSDVTRGYITDQIGKTVDLIEDSIGNPNGGGGLPKIKDFLNGKWDDQVVTREIADARSIAGSSLVSNPGFEKESFWHGGGTLTTEIRRTGTKSMRVTATGSAQKVYLTCDTAGPAKIAATAGDIFYVEAWVWGKSTNTQVSGGANGMSIYIEVFTKDGVQIGQPLTTNGPTASNGLNSQWTKFVGYIAIPTTSPYNQTASMSAYIGVNSNVSSGSVYYFDDPIIRVDSLVNSWNYIYDGANGTSGSFGKLPFDLLNPLQNLRQRSIDAASGASGALNTAQTAASGAAGAQGLINDTIQAIVVGFKSWTGIDLNPAAVQSSADAISTAMSTMAGVTANLTAQRDAGMFYGTAVHENFAEYTVGTTIGPKWTTWSSGTGTAVWGIGALVPGFTEEYAIMSPLAGAVNRQSSVRLVTQTATKYQRIGVVLSSVGGVTQSAPTSGTRHWFRIYGRVNEARTQYVFVEFRATEIIIGFNSGGGDQFLAGSLKSYTYKPGVPYWFECGTSQSSPRTYRLWEGTTPLVAIPDGSGGSPNSDTEHLGAGFGGWVSDHRYKVPNVAGFTLLDNVPPLVRGMGFKSYNLTDGANFNVSGSASATATGFFPTNWYGTEPEHCTANMLWDASTNTLTVSEPGHYLVTIGQKGSYENQNVLLVPVQGRISAGLFIDKGDGLFNSMEFAPSTAWSSIKESFGGVFYVYLKGGWRIRPGWKSWWSTSGNTYKGSAQGETYLSVAFLNNRYEKITSV